MYFDALHIRLCMLCNSTLPPCICASACATSTCLFVCLFVCFPFRLFLLIDGQWTSAKSNCTHSIRRGLGIILRSSLLLNSSPRCVPPCSIVYYCFNNNNSSPSTIMVHPLVA